MQAPITPNNAATLLQALATPHYSAVLYSEYDCDIASNTLLARVHYNNTPLTSVIVPASMENTLTARENVSTAW